MNYLQNVFDYLFMQLRICRISYILLLYSRIYESRIKMVFIILIRIDTDDLCQYYFHAFLTDTFSEVNQVRRITGLFGSKFKLSAKILVVSILTPL